MTDTNQKTGKPAVATPAKVASAPKPAAKAAAVKTPVAKAPAVKAQTVKPTPAVKPAPIAAEVAKAATPAIKVAEAVIGAPVTAAKTTEAVVKATETVVKATEAVAKAVVTPPAPVAKAPAKPVAKLAATKIAKPVAAKPAPKPVVKKAVAPKAAAPKSAAQTLMDISMAPEAPVVKAVAAAIQKPVSKPVEAPVSSSIAAKASTIPPLPKFMVSPMSTQTFKGYEDFAAFGKANLEAFVQANKLFTTGIETLSKEVVSLAQSSLESSTAATKAMFAAKTIKDVVELQTDFAKTSFEKLVANSTKIGEMTVKLATDSAAPIGARVTAASEKVMKKA